jgi:hypothetical protein
MKPRVPFISVIGLLIISLSSACTVAPKQGAAASQVFEAVINRDCAPWDGTAFRIMIRLTNEFSGSFIDISIWQDPGINFPITFSFPDETSRLGNAVYRSSSGNSEPLRGRVTLQRVRPGVPVDGEFSLATDRGGKFNGKFKAEWGDQAAICG